ncbi:hypothetical protein Goari_010489, partial [Gossypium aridum]|nr:hypothetical protein [Gossypium aridum]
MHAYSPYAAGLLGNDRLVRCNPIPLRIDYSPITLIARNRHYAPSAPITYSVFFPFLLFHFLPSSSTFRFSDASLRRFLFIAPISDFHYSFDPVANIQRHLCLHHFQSRSKSVGAWGFCFSLQIDIVKS